jgi:hypothetical protein
MQAYAGNSEMMEASQFGGYFHPTASSWCPFDTVPEFCPAEIGLSIVGNTTQIHSGPTLYNIYASVALAKRTASGPNPINKIKVTNHPFQLTMTQIARTQFVAGFLPL